MSLIQLRWINLHRLALTSKKLFITRKISIHRIKMVENLKLNKVLENKEKLNNDHWLLIREDLCKNTSQVNDSNADCAIIDICWDADQRELALNYVQYLLRTEKKKLNIGTTGRYFKLLHDLERPLSPQEVEEIYQLYDDLIKEYPVVDALTAENLLFGLSLTDRWKECFKLLDMIEEFSTSRRASCSAIISAAFDHDEFTIGWKYLESMFPRLTPNYSTYNSFLNYCKRVSKNTRELEYVVNKLFLLWKKHDITPPYHTVMLFVDALTSTGEWTALKTTVGPKGDCRSCKNVLEPLRIDEKEFKHLSDAVLSNVLVGKDIYNRTTPQELRKFNEFVNSTKPYDVCIDGLNVAYVLSRSKKSSLSKELTIVVEELLKQYKRIFVLGRKHMIKWPLKDMDFVRKNCYIFFAHDLSEDDPFLLYATLASGINTYFVSRDLMRQHKFLIKDEKTQQIFRHWQMCRQIFPMYVGLNSHRIMLLIRPPQYLPVAQKDSAGWHIPYSTRTSSVSKLHDLNIPKAPETWICLRKIS